MSSLGQSFSEMAKVVCFSSKDLEKVCVAIL